MTISHTPAMVTRLPEFSEHTLPKSKVPAGEANESRTEKAPSTKSVAGLLVMDCSLSLVSFTAEAIQILGYPDNIASLTSSEVLLTEKIRSSLITRPSAGESAFVREFRSGRRRYFCRAFAIDSHAKGMCQPSMVVLLERGPARFAPLSQVCHQFNLTQREQEVLQYLLQGMSSKAIADRMNVSPQTVRVFLRLIMIKTGVSSRSAMVRKIIMSQLQQSLDPPLTA
jgi:DNA-binding CsgD family transcriptional regulator